MRKYIYSLIILLASCSKENIDNNGRIHEPGDSFFSNEEIYEGVQLDITKIDQSKLIPLDGDPEVGSEEYSNLVSQRVEILQNMIKDMAYVDGGSFYMGATFEQGDNVHIYEFPVHQVTLSDYYISKFEVTQELFWIVMGGKNTGSFSDLKMPITKKNIVAINNFISRLNEITGLDFSLPTEAQWEFAARGGRKRLGYMYSGSNNIDDVACYWENSLNEENEHTPKNVGSYVPNELGIYDMSGNVSEICLDYYDKYNKEEVMDPIIDDNEGDLIYKVCRGGSYYTYKDACRISSRASFKPENSYVYIGFRLVHNINK